MGRWSLSEPRGRIALPNHLKLAFETIVCQPEEHDGGLKYMANFVLPKTWASFLAAGIWRL